LRRPAEVWKKYSKSGDLGYFQFQEHAENRKQSNACLNELVTDALELAPDCLAYLSLLECSEVFRFCAIPQVREGEWRRKRFDDDLSETCLSCSVQRYENLKLRSTICAC